MSSRPSPRPRRRGPKPLLGDQPRDRIHDVALNLFERKGINATSMDDVARELGVSRPTLYNYYGTKEALLQEVVARQAEAILTEVSKKLRVKAGVHRIVEAANLGLMASLDNTYVRMMIEGAAAPLTGTVLETPRVLGVQRAFWQPLLEAAVETGDLRTDRPLDDIMEWIIFTQFSLATVGVAFGMTRRQMRERIDAYLSPALGGGVPPTRSRTGATAG